jgi:hypothetical protein
VPAAVDVPDVPTPLELCWLEPMPVPEDPMEEDDKPETADEPEPEAEAAVCDAVVADGATGDELTEPDAGVLVVLPVCWLALDAADCAVACAGAEEAVPP